MKIALFGATGHIGGHVLRLALDQGHEVTAFVRDRSGIDVHTATACHVIVGSLENQTSVRYALEGADAVIVTLAAGSRVLERFDASALPILKASGPRRIVSMVGASVRMPGDPKSFKLRLMTAVMRLVPGGLLRDAEGHARRLASSGLDWTLVRSANFADMPATGSIHATLDGDMPLGASITHADLAEFILAAAVRGNYLGQAPMVCNG
jgi:uncharacterized protein YbjT (DUF2867 family)